MNKNDSTYARRLVLLVSRMFVVELARPYRTFSYILMRSGDY